MTEDEKDAEIARLKEALESVSDHGSALERMEMLKSQQAEIERLRAATPWHIVVVIDENTKLKAEIERLRGEIEIHEGAIAGLGAICRDKNKLITELADALKIVREAQFEVKFAYPTEMGPKQLSELLQRAMEAAK